MYAHMHIAYIMVRAYARVFTSCTHSPDCTIAPRTYANSVQDYAAHHIVTAVGPTPQLGCFFSACICINETAGCMLPSLPFLVHVWKGFVFLQLLETVPNRLQALNPKLHADKTINAS